jgi:hypothetical protein
MKRKGLQDNERKNDKEGITKLQKNSAEPQLINGIVRKQKLRKT